MRLLQQTLHSMLHGYTQRQRYRKNLSSRAVGLIHTGLFREEAVQIHVYVDTILDQSLDLLPREYYR